MLPAYPGAMQQRSGAGLFWLGLLLSIVGAIGAAWSAGQLTHGLMEIPGHWWSTLMVAPGFVGVALLVLSRRV
jgi:uncharacterized membrane protein YeaQ/YmgE (transglycosylase-associated protein family)